jgi:hypothetical protein
MRIIARIATALDGKGVRAVRLVVVVLGVGYSVLIPPRPVRVILV